jgi:hypothetical protein
MSKDRKQFVDLRIDKASGEAGGKKKARAFIPRSMQNITKRVLTHSPLNSKKHHKGQEQWQQGLVDVWERGGVGYGVKVEDKDKLKGVVPKISVSQDKNIKLLLAMVEQQQIANAVKIPEATFTLKEYANKRGYDDTEVAKGGKFMDELKRDLYSGAYTTYKVDKIKIDGKIYTAHGIPNFYTLLEPENKKAEWRVIFTSFYADKILEVLNGQAPQFYTHQLKEIADRTTTERDYLHYFYSQLVEAKRKESCSMPMKVRTLLTNMGCSDKTLKRPQECYKVLKDCLVYTSKHYPDDLESILLSYTGSFTKEADKGKELKLSSLHTLENWDYTQIKELIKGLGVKDIRDCYISFCEHTEPKALTLPLHTYGATATVSNGILVNEIMDWIEDWEGRNDYPIKFTVKDRQKFLTDCEKQLGTNRLRELFKGLNNERNPSPITFITKTLPQQIKALKNIRNDTQNRDAYNEAKSKLFSRGDD